MEIGLLGMREGGKRCLNVPPYLNEGPGSQQIPQEVAVMIGLSVSCRPNFMLTDVSEIFLIKVIKPDLEDQAQTRRPKARKIKG